MADDGKRVETLLVEEGQKYDPATGEGAIASLGGYGGELVFLPTLPKSVQPDTNPAARVRVVVEEVGTKDKRGRPLWRAKPAPDETEEVWEQESDTVRRIAIRRNWCLAEVRRETLEERPAGTRDGASRETSEFVLFFEATLDDSFVLESRIRVIPEERETAVDGKPVWKKVSERREPITDTQHAVTAIVAKSGWSTWHEVRLEPSYPADKPVALSVTYQKGDGTIATREDKVEWGELPAWLQDQLTTPYPLCDCGRQRHEEQADGYGKCELCRAEETCERCGKQAKVSVVFDHLTCDACKPSATLELMIEATLKPEHRQRIAEEAACLRQAEAMEREAGETILGATLGHITDSWRRNNLVSKWTGYGWYYFGEGIFGSKFAPAALALVEYLPAATGNGLVELVAWIAGGVKPSGSSDYYLRTQVNGEQGVTPSFTEDQLKQIVAKIETGEPVLADWLRGSEADRQQALRELAELESSAGKHHSSLSQVKQNLQGDLQDYVLALQQLATAREIVEEEKRLQKLLERDYPVCPLCGGPWHDSRDEEVEKPYHGVTCSCPDAGKKGEQGQEFPIKQSLAPEDGRLLVQATMAYGSFRHGYVEVEVRLDVLESAIPDDLKVTTKQLVGATEAKQRQRAMEADNRLAEELRRCEGDYPSRFKISFQADPDHEGRIFGDAELPAEVVVYDQSGNEHKISFARFVCDPAHCGWLGEIRPKAGEVWVCSLGKKIGTRKGRPIVIVNPQIQVDDDKSEPAPNPASGEGEDGNDLDALAAAWGARLSE